LVYQYLSRLLRDETYIGKTHFNKRIAVEAVNPRKKDGYRKIKKTSRKNRPPEEWCQILVPPIVEEEVFIGAQQQLKTNSQFCMRNKVHEYLLSTLVRCTCGNTRAGEGVKEHLYYRCTDRVNRFPLPKECFVPGVSAPILDTMVWKEMYDLITDPKKMEDQYERWKMKIVSVQENPEYVDVISLIKS